MVAVALVAKFKRERGNQHWDRNQEPEPERGRVRGKAAHRAAGDRKAEVEQPPETGARAHGANDVNLLLLFLVFPVTPRRIRGSLSRGRTESAVPTVTINYQAYPAARADDHESRGFQESPLLSF